MRVLLADDAIQLRLAPWEKLLGLLGNVTVALSDVSDVRVVADPLREAMHAGMKAGLRVPWLIYVARTIRLDEVFVVRRGQPGLSFAVTNHKVLRRVLVSTPDAAEIARRLSTVR